MGIEPVHYKDGGFKFDGTTWTEQVLENEVK